MDSLWSFRAKEDSLSHHGIEGQQWGIRNGPPYPLGSGQRSKAEVRAMRNESKEANESLKRAVKNGGRTWNIYKFDKNLSNIVSSKIQENKEEYFNLFRNSIKDLDYLVDRAIEEGWIKKEDRDRTRELYFVSDIGQELYEKWLDKHPDKVKEFFEVEKESYKAKAELTTKLLNISRTTLGKYADQEIANDDGYWKRFTASHILLLALHRYIGDLYLAESK